MYHLYIVRCNDGTLYTGIAKDLSRRINEHNKGIQGAKYTRARRPVKLVFSKQFRSRSTATKAEMKIKKLSRSEKIHLIRTNKYDS